MSGAFLLRLGLAKAMLELMKNMLLKSLLLATLMFSLSVTAGLYKGLDEEGNTVYSDTPFENAKEIKPPPLTVSKPFKAPPKAAVKETAAEQASPETKYTKFSIVSPTNNQTIRNVPNIMVNVQITPKLNIKKGDNIWLLFDGKALVKNSRSTSIPIGRANRGLHTVQVQLRSKTGKVIKHSNTVTIHVKNSVAPIAPPLETP